MSSKDSKPVASNLEPDATQESDAIARAARDAAVDQRAKSYEDNGDKEAAQRVREVLTADEQTEAPAPADKPKEDPK